MYTNGAYLVFGSMVGFWRWKKLKGYIVNSKFPNVYSVYQDVVFNKYHLFWDKEPQFKPLKEANK